jgi:hypothetical protein
MGGTGRFVGVRGIQPDHNVVELVMSAEGKLEAKTNWGKRNGEYWFEK